VKISYNCNHDTMLVFAKIAYILLRHFNWTYSHTHTPPPPLRPPQIPTFGGTNVYRPVIISRTSGVRNTRTYIFICEIINYPPRSRKRRLFVTTTIVAPSAGLRLVFSKQNLLVLCLFRSRQITASPDIFML
jgi:hypothetical protein